jgi:iron complex transport system substrate-binding protein
MKTGHLKYVLRTALGIAPLLLVVGLLTIGRGAQAGSPAPLVDDAGRTMERVRPFERVISLYGAHTENLFRLGAGNILIGAGRSDRYPPRARALPVFSYHDGPERFLAADPDLVLIRPMIDRGYAPLIRRLEQSGITVVSLQPSTVDEMYAYWHKLGRLCGRMEQAAAMVSAFQQAVADFQALTAAIRPRKRVYFEAIHRRMKTFTPGSMPIFALETAGGVNIAADALQVRTTNIAYYGKERLLSRAAEIDVYLAQQGAMNQVTPEDIRAEAGYEVIKAIKDDQVFIIDETIVARPTWRLLYGIQAIGRLLYGERFQGPGQRILDAAEATLAAADAAQ